MAWYEFLFRIYLHVLSKAFSYSGRSGRSEYWGFALANITVAIVIFIVDKIIGLDRMAVRPDNVYWLVMVVPSLALTIRRLHDIGKSGWWYLLLLIPVIGAIVLFIWAARDSERAANRFGDRPVPPYPTPAMFERFEIVAELLAFLWTQRLWWMIPLVIMMLLVGGLIAFANATALGPFIYPLI